MSVPTVPIDHHRARLAVLERRIFDRDIIRHGFCQRIGPRGLGFGASDDEHREEVMALPLEAIESEIARIRVLVP